VKRTTSEDAGKTNEAVRQREIADNWREVIKTMNEFCGGARHNSAVFSRDLQRLLAGRSTIVTVSDASIL